MKKKHIYAILCFVWMVVIFMYSHQPAETSQGLSNGVIKAIESILNINIIDRGGGFFDMVSFLVRKSAHMSEYALLAILFSLFMKEVGYKNVWLYAIFGVLLYAISDEVHQLFIVGRSGQWSDVCIDTLGGTMGLVLLYGVQYIRSIGYQKWNLNK